MSAAATLATLQKATLLHALSPVRLASCLSLFLVLPLLGDMLCATEMSTNEMKFVSVSVFGRHVYVVRPGARKCREKGEKGSFEAPSRRD